LQTFILKFEDGSSSLAVLPEDMERQAANWVLKRNAMRHWLYLAQTGVYEMQVGGDGHRSQLTIPKSSMHQDSYLHCK